MPGPSMPHATPPPAAPPPGDGDLFELGRLKDYLGFVARAAMRHRRLALGTFLGVLLLAVVALQVVPIRWQVQATLLAQRSSLMGTLSNPGMNREWDAPTRSAREVLLRRENLVALCKQTNFVERYLASRAPAVRLRDWIYANVLRQERTREQLTDGLVDGIQARLWVAASPEGTVTITFEWADRVLAYDLVQAAVQSFLEERYLTEIKMVGETIAILEGHDARLQKEIAATISALEQKVKALHIRIAPRLTPAPRARPERDEETARLETTLAARRRALADLEEFRQRRLGELQSQLTQELGVYAPQHPTVIGTRHAIESASRPSPQMEALRLEVAELDRQVTRRGGRTDPFDGAGVQGELAAVAQARLEMDDPRLEYERRQLDQLLRQHSNLLERIDAARVEMDTAQAAFKYRYSVLTPPRLPKQPAKPYGMLFGVGGLVGGLALALFAAAAKDLRSGRVLERWQVERDLDLPVVGELRR